MKEIFDNDMNNIDEVQKNTLEDMGIGLNNSLHSDFRKDDISDSNSDDLVYSNLEEVKTSNHMYKNLDTESVFEPESILSTDSKEGRKTQLEDDIDLFKVDVVETSKTSKEDNKTKDSVENRSITSNNKNNETDNLVSNDDITKTENVINNDNNSKNDDKDIEDKTDIEFGFTSSLLAESVEKMLEEDKDKKDAHKHSLQDSKLEEKGLENNDKSDDKEDNVIEKQSDDKYVIDGESDSNTQSFGHKFVDVEKEEAKKATKEAEGEDKDMDLISDDIAPYISKMESTSKKKGKKSSHKKVWMRIGIIAAVFALIGTSAFLVIQSIANKINFTDFSDTVEQEEQFDTESVLSDNAEVVKVSEFNWDMIKGDPTYDENIYNILIIGGDIAGTKDARGNSDTLIIVSIDKNTKRIKLSSIMRDTYVPIPGYSDNKINSAYATGGVPLVKQVIEENFKVTIDSTVVVNYSTFVKAIQKLGGVKGVELNYSEARFINRECGKQGHSSDLTEGTHDLDAYQALHFARIRKISSDIYGSDDFGRTARQRYVINQLFKQYKDLNYAQLAGVLTSVMGELEVDEVLKKDLFLLAQVALKFDAETLDEFRLPMDDAYSFASVPIPGSGQNMSVVRIDDYWQTNVDELHRFIYGTTEY